jgi:hypothetical protein
MFARADLVRVEDDQVLASGGVVDSLVADDDVRHAGIAGLRYLNRISEAVALRVQRLREHLAMQLVRARRSR